MKKILSIITIFISSITLCYSVNDTTKQYKCEIKPLLKAIKIYNIDDEMMVVGNITIEYQYDGYVPVSMTKFLQEKNTYLLILEKQE